MSSLQHYFLPSFDELAEEFESIKNSSLSGVSGIVSFDSGIPGPRVGITIHTHGNEPCGMATLRYFRQKGLVKKLQKGSVVFVLNNLKATEEYYKLCMGLMSSETEDLKLKTRFLNVNMNRLPPSTMNMNSDGAYEILRAQELQSIWSSFDFAFDIHSMKSASPAMVIALTDTKDSLFNNFPVEIVIRNIEKVQKNKPACSFYGYGNTENFVGMEGGGPHESPKCLRLAIDCMLAFLESTNILGEKEVVKRSPPSEYWISGSVFFPDSSYELVKPLKNFEEIHAGKVLAKGNGPDICMPFDGCTIFGPPGTKPTAPLTDEVLFLSLPVNARPE